MKTNPTDPAYPMIIEDVEYEGLTKREHFAGLILAGLSSDADIILTCAENHNLARVAVDEADNLIAELNKKEPAHDTDG